MNDSEKSVYEYLRSRRSGTVIYEPDGNVPSDFLDRTLLRQLIQLDHVWSKSLLVNPLNLPADLSCDVRRPRCMKRRRYNQRLQPSAAGAIMSGRG